MGLIRLYDLTNSNIRIFVQNQRAKRKRTRSKKTLVKMTRAMMRIRTMMRKMTMRNLWLPLRPEPLVDGLSAD